MFGRITIVTIISLITLTINGCFSSNPEDIAAFVKPQQADVTAENYILQPPDEVQVLCSKVPELNLQTQQIRPDGKISFEAVGEIVAAGKTPSQLANSIRAKILELYKLTGENPIDVRITVFQSKVYYVIGQVNSPGPKPYTGRDTVLSAISQAVPTVLAWHRRIQIVRPSRDKNIKPKIFEVNFDRMTAHGEASKDVMLEEGDIIFVPPTILAAAAMIIQEVTAPIGSTFSTVNMITGTPVRTAGGGGVR